jgi:hypothetical protein
MTDLLAHEKNPVVALHLLGHGLVERFPERYRRHRYRHSL